MAGKGRPPKPAAMKQLEGDKTKRGIPSEPQPAPGFPTMPAGLTPDVVAVWDTLAAAIAPMGHLTQADAWPLTTLCKAIARQAECELRTASSGGLVVMGKDALVRNPWEVTRERAVLEAERLMTRLSLSPQDRAKLGLMGLQAARELKQSGSPLEEFLDG